ncbi:MAG: hypothetical protein WBA97_18940 [Actinophytocola sp.]|uniref:hypothetical protein n=1 Tax=Actinophytocola sp. TaxID=1872138 RepID=UPI003C73C7DC
MAADWLARVIAIGGAMLAAASLLWNIVAWRRQGPVVRVEATCSGRGNEMKIQGRIFNKGRLDAQVIRVSAGWGISSENVRFGPKADISAKYVNGLNFPMLIEAQRGYDFTIEPIPEVDAGLSSALHDNRSAQLRFHTASGRVARAKIKFDKN